MSGVFISYRRSDSGGWAGRLFDHLSMRFGKDLVFQDFDDIKSGTDFLKVIRTAIKVCDVVLVLIGPHWLKNAEGRRRLDNPQDVLRMEISEALKGAKTVIPILLGGASMPSAENLPDPIKSLARQHAVEVTDSRWDYDVGQLIERLRELILPREGQLSLPQAQQELREKQLRYFEILPHNAAGALELAQQALAFLDRVSPLYPHDPYLQLVRGYFHKNEAMALRNLGRYEEFEKALNEAERVFDTMIRERPADAGAWNGKGSVEALRGNFKEALRFIDRALEIDPNFEAAKKDREEILGRL
jgi:tetratricopeptide (TPR) repeat protein